MLRKNDLEKSITKETFENLTRSIFQPLSDIADKLDLDVEKEKSNDTSEPIQEVTIWEEDEITLPNIITRSKSQKKPESEDEY